MPTIDFNNQASLAALPDRGLGQWAVFYKEDGMTIRDGLDPPDPRLGNDPTTGKPFDSADLSPGHYHLLFEDPSLKSDPKTGKLPIDPSTGEPLDPASQPRLLANHSDHQVIQLTYDPNGDGFPDPFQLLSIDVLSGRLNVGVQFTSGDIGVYNNLRALQFFPGTPFELTAGINWQFTDARDFTLNRVTLEGVGPRFSVDNIVFDAVAKAFDPMAPFTSNTLPFLLEDTGAVGLTPERHELLTRQVPEVIGDDNDNVIEGTAKSDLLVGLGGNHHPRLRWG
jgi:hypothetical protein